MGRGEKIGNAAQNEICLSLEGKYHTFVDEGWDDVLDSKPRPALNYATVPRTQAQANRRVASPRASTRFGSRIYFNYFNLSMNEGP